MGCDSCDEVNGEVGARCQVQWTIDVLSLLLATAGIMATAPVPPFSLLWDAPSGCPRVDQVRSQIERLLPSSPVEKQPTLEVKAAVIAGEDGQWHLRMQTRRGDQQGERELTSESCMALAESAAVIVGLMLNPMSGPEPPAPKPPILPAASPSASAPVTAKPLPVPRAIRFVVGVEGTLERGPLPRMDCAFGVLVGMRGSDWRAEGATRFRLPERQMSGANGQAGGDFWLLSTAIRGCWMLGQGHVRGGPCGQADAGAMRGRSFGVNIPDQSWTPWLAVGLGPMVTMNLTARWALRATGQASLALLRPRFEIDGVGLVHQPSRVSFEGGLGAEALF